MKKRGIFAIIFIFLIITFMTVLIFAQENQTIKCYSSKDCPITSQNWCDGSSACQKLAQCLNPGTIQSECSVVDECVNCVNIGYIDCKDGQCRKINCYKDTDCGESFTKKYCRSLQACTYEVSYSCQNPGTVDSSCIINKGVENCMPCTSNCQDGMCNEVPQPLTQLPATCTDSDGIDFYQQGTTCTEINCVSDRCVGNAITVM